MQSLTEDVSVFHERIIAVDKTEELVVNVLFDSSNSVSATQNDTQGKTSYLIDIYSNAKAKGNISGDVVSSYKLQKYLGMCRYILQSHKYNTLGLPLGTIGNTNVDSLQVYEQENTPDTNFGRMARINFSVRLMENQQVWEGVLADQNITQSKLELTEKGYQYKLKE